MIARRLSVAAMALVLVTAACRRDPPPPPAPTGPTAEEIARARQDSIAAAERVRQDSIRAAEERARAAAEAAQREARAALEAMIHFDYDEAALTAQAESILREKVDVLRANPDVRMRIAGHADERGSTEYNLALASRRAETARQFMTGFGLDAARFQTVSFGEENPIATGSNESAWAQNRRAEFQITSGGATLQPPR